MTSLSLFVLLLFEATDTMESGDSARPVLRVILGIREGGTERREASLEVEKGGRLGLVCVQFVLTVQRELETRKCGRCLKKSGRMLYHPTLRETRTETKQNHTIYAGYTSTMKW